MESKVTFTNSNGVRLSGVLSVPKIEKPPIVILCHGLNSGKDSKTNLVLNEILKENGIASFRFDFFSHGESKGNPKDRSVNEFVDDILNAVAYLKSKGYNKIGIVGGSFGAVAAVIAASKSTNLNFIALKSPGMGKTSRNMLNYKNDFDAKSWINAGQKITIPTLIVHGSADQDVEVELGKRLAKSIGTSKIEIVEGADHQYTRKEDFDKAIKLISDFVIKEACT